MRNGVAPSRRRIGGHGHRGARLASGCDGRRVGAAVGWSRRRRASASASASARRRRRAPPLVRVLGVPGRLGVPDGRGTGPRRERAEPRCAPARAPRRWAPGSGPRSPDRRGDARRTRPVDHARPARAPASAAGRVLGLLPLGVVVVTVPRRRTPRRAAPGRARWAPGRGTQRHSHPTGRSGSQLAPSPPRERTSPPSAGPTRSSRSADLAADRDDARPDCPRSAKHHDHERVVAVARPRQRRDRRRRRLVRALAEHAAASGEGRMRPAASACGGPESPAPDPCRVGAARGRGREARRGGHGTAAEARSAVTRGAADPAQPVRRLSAVQPGARRGLLDGA